MHEILWSTSDLMAPFNKDNTIAASTKAPMFFQASAVGATIADFL